MGRGPVQTDGFLLHREDDTSLTRISETVLDCSLVGGDSGVHGCFRVSLVGDPESPAPRRTVSRPHVIMDTGLAYVTTGPNS